MSSYLKIRLFICRVVVLLRRNKYFNLVKFIKLLKITIFNIKKNSKRQNLLDKIGLNFFDMPSALDLESKKLIWLGLVLDL